MPQARVPFAWQASILPAKNSSHTRSWQAAALDVAVEAELGIVEKIGAEFQEERPEVPIDAEK
jgi:hypothetical protein